MSHVIIQIIHVNSIINHYLVPSILKEMTPKLCPNFL